MLLILALVIVLALATLPFWKSVPKNYVGVVWHELSSKGRTGEILPEGRHLLLPWERIIEEVSLEQQRVEFEETALSYSGPSVIVKGYFNWRPGAVLEIGAGKPKKGDLDFGQQIMTFVTINDQPKERLRLVSENLRDVVRSYISTEIKQRDFEIATQQYKEIETEVLSAIKQPVDAGTSLQSRHGEVELRFGVVIEGLSISSADPTPSFIQAQEAMAVAERQKEADIVRAESIALQIQKLKDLAGLPELSLDQVMSLLQMLNRQEMIDKPGTEIKIFDISGIDMEKLAPLIRDASMGLSALSNIMKGAKGEPKKGN